MNENVVLTDDDILQLSSLINKAIMKRNPPVNTTVTPTIQENFNCNNVCTKPENKTLLEREETKILILLLILIVFYGYIGR
jgi:hypothetical protein